DKVSPAVDVAYAARSPQAVARAFGVEVPEDVEVAAVIWTTTPWTLPASLATSMGDAPEYTRGEAPATDGSRRRLVRAARADESEVPVLLGDHVSAEDGTGAVHTAPGHGQEDYAVGRQYGLLEKYGAAELNPVDGRGVYLPSTPAAHGVELAGLHIWKANDVI